MQQCVHIGHNSTCRGHICYCPAFCRQNVDVCSMITHTNPLYSSWVARLNGRPSDKGIKLSIELLRIPTACKQRAIDQRVVSEYHVGRWRWCAVLGQPIVNSLCPWSVSVLCTTIQVTWSTTAIPVWQYLVRGQRSLLVTVTASVVMNNCHLPTAVTPTMIHFVCLPRVTVFQRHILHSGSDS